MVFIWCYKLLDLRKNAKLIKSPYRREFKRGQKVYSHGDKTTFGYIDDWDDSEGCWRLRRHKEDGYHWWAEDEPTASIIDD